MVEYSPHLATGTIERVCSLLGTDPPKGYTDSRADAEQLKVNLAKFSNPDTGKNLLDAVFDAVADGRHPADCEDVRRLALTVQLENYELHRQAEDRSRRIVGDAVQRHADDFIQSWAKATEADGAVLAATAKIGLFAAVPNLHEMALAQLVDPDDHRTWVATTIAARRLDAAADGFGSLITATQLRHRQEHRMLVLAPDLGLDNYDAIRRGLDTRQQADAWTLARAGITPRLCGSLAAFVEAVGALTAQQAHRDAEAAEQSKPDSFGGTTRGQRRTATIGQQ